MGKEEKFYKKRPIISNIISAVIGGLLIFLITWLLPSVKECKNEVEVNGKFNTGYTLINNGVLTTNGVVQMISTGFNETKINEYGHIIQKDDNRMIVEYKIPGGETLEIKTATSTSVGITRLK